MPVFTACYPTGAGYSIVPYIFNVLQLSFFFSFFYKKGGERIKALNCWGLVGQADWDEISLNDSF